MFYLVTKPGCSLKALTTAGTDTSQMELRAIGARTFQPDEDMWDYTEWRLYTDHGPSDDEVLVACRNATPNPAIIDFIIFWPGKSANACILHPATLAVIEREEEPAFPPDCGLFLDRPKPSRHRPSCPTSRDGKP